MLNRTERLEALDKDTRAIVLDLLDELSQPLTRREIEKVLARQGYTRARRSELVPALMNFDIVAIVPRAD